MSWADAPATAHDLAAAAEQQLDVVDDGAGGHVAQRQRVADPDLGVRTGDDDVADLEAAGARM